MNLFSSTNRTGSLWTWWWSLANWEVLQFGDFVAGLGNLFCLRHKLQEMEGESPKMIGQRVV